MKREPVAEPVQTVAIFGEDCRIQPGAIVGLAYKEGCQPTRVGDHAVIRTGTIIYADCDLGEHFQSGHHVLIREATRIGRHVVVGSHTVIDGQVRIGDFVKIESNCYIPTQVVIGRRVFLGPNVVLTNDRYPLKMRDRYQPEGPVIGDGVTIGANATIVPGVRLGTGAFVAAGAVVTKDVPPQHLARGNPARFFPLPEHLKEPNLALSWRKFAELLPDLQ